MKTPLQLDIFSTSVVLLFANTPTYVNSHGALKFPASRQWICSGGALPNLGVGVNGIGGAKVCRAQSHRDYALNHNINKLIRDWSGVAQLPGGFTSGSFYPQYPNYQTDPRYHHIKKIGNGDLNHPICGAATDIYQVLESPAWQDRKNHDKSYPQRIWPGKRNFVYAVSKTHRTANGGYVDVYITKPRWNTDESVTWNDIEEKPFCHFVPNDKLKTPFQNFKCKVPERYGHHVLFTVWQRQDSEEAFYGCSDIRIISKSNKKTKPNKKRVNKINKPIVNVARKVDQEAVKFCESCDDVSLYTGCFYPFKGDGTKYYTCVHRAPVAKSCAPGLKWDDWEKTCSW